MKRKGEEEKKGRRGRGSSSYIYYFQIGESLSCYQLLAVAIMSGVGDIMVLVVVGVFSDASTNFHHPGESVSSMGNGNFQL